MKFFAVILLVSLMMTATFIQEASARRLPAGRPVPGGPPGAEGERYGRGYEAIADGAFAVGDGVRPVP